jgi:hypothetical protein
MKITFLLFLLIFAFHHSSFSQDYFINFFSDSTNLYVADLQVTSNSNLILFGNTIETDQSKLLFGINFICFDTLGHLKFQKRYFADQLIEHPVGHVAGKNFLFSGSIPGIHGSLFKTDSLGILQFSKGYGDTLNWTVSTDALLLQSGNSLSLGLNRDFSDNNFDLVIAKLDAEGNLIFCKRLDIDTHELSKKICIISPNEFLVSGTVTDIAQGHNDILMLKIDSDANVNFCKRYLSPFKSLDVLDFIYAKEGFGYFLLSTLDSGSTQLYPAVLKVDSSGHALWLHRLMSSENFSATHLKMIRQNLLISGNLKIETDTSEINKGVFLEMDSAGELLWTKSLTLYGNNTLNAACSIGGSVYLAGSVTVSPLPRDYYFVAKTFEGNTPGCEEELFNGFSIAEYQISNSDVVVAVSPFGKQYTTNWEQATSGTFSNYCSDNAVIDPSNGSSLIIFPNPTGDFVIFNLPDFTTSDWKIAIYNSTGQLLNRFSFPHSYQLKIPVSEIGSDGMYFYTIKATNEKTFAGKFLIQR